VKIEKGSWPVLPIFELFRRIGNVSEREMYRTFNMGVGMVIVCSRSDLDPVKSHLKERGDKCYQIGAVVEGNREVLL
jgi:phosphoribosylformylglycinamidine cyclo-ligase